jgi:hypothetical protein
MSLQTYSKGFAVAAALLSASALVGHVTDAGAAARLAILRDGRRQARERTWANGAAPERITLDFDATLVTSHSEKEGAAGNFKGGFGFHPLPAVAALPIGRDGYPTPCQQPLAPLTERSRLRQTRRGHDVA